MKILSMLAASFVLFSIMPGQAQAAQIKMVQCEVCSSVAGLKGTATNSGVGDWAVFSIKNRIIARYIVEYDAEFDTLRTWPMVTPGPIEDGFALMLEVEAESPHFFSSGQQSFQVDIDKLGGGSHNPVTISLN